ECVDATCGTAWCPTFSPADAGRYIIETRATDRVAWLQNPVGSYTVYVDKQPPTAMSGIAPNTLLPAPAHPSRRYTRLVSLHGSATDPLIQGGYTPSGVVRVRASVFDSAGHEAGPRDQVCTLVPAGPATAAAWSLELLLERAEATGTYILDLETLDAVGNAAVYPAALTFRVDANAPVVTLLQPDPADSGQGSITDPSALVSGVVSDTVDLDGQPVFHAGVSEVEIAFTPTTTGTIFSPHLPEYALSFERPWLADGMTFADGDDARQATLSTGDDWNHVVRGQVGDYALYLDGADDAVAIAPTVALANESFTIQFWAKTEARGAIVRHGGTGGTLLLGLNPEATGGGFTFSFDGSEGRHLSRALAAEDSAWRVEAGPKLSGELLGVGDGWVNYAFVYDADANQRRVYYRSYGSELWSGTTADTTGDYAGAGPMLLGDVPSGATRFRGALDGLTVHSRALSLDEIDATDAGWWPVQTLTLAAGGGTGTWSHPVPAGLEGFYAIRLRGTDVFSNTSSHKQTVGLWGGHIDNRAPRISLKREYLGSGDDAKTRLIGYAADLNLDEAGFECPCPPEAVQRVLLGEPWYTSIFTDSAPRLVRLDYACEVAGHDYGGAVLRARDVFGHAAEDIRGGIVALGAYDAPYEVAALDVEDDVAVLAMPGVGLEIVDASDPAAPVKLGDSYATPITGQNNTSVSCRRGVSEFVRYVNTKIGIAGYPALHQTIGSLTVSYSVRTGTYGSDNLKIWLVSPQGTRKLLRQYSGSWNYTFNDVYTPTEFIGQAIVGDWELWVDDVQTMEATLQRWSLSITPEARDPRDVAVQGNYAYVADGGGALRVYDISSPAAPYEANYALLGPGAAAVAYDGQAAISDDGRYVAFVTAIADLVPNDANSAADIFVYDRVTDSFANVSLRHDGTQQTLNVGQPSLSADGRFVAFECDSAGMVPGLVGSGREHIYVRDRDLDDNGVFDEAGAGKTSVVMASVSSAGVAGNAISLNPSISADGRFVVFHSYADNLVAGDTVRCTGSGAYDRSCVDIFVRDRDLDANGVFDEAGAGKTATVRLMAYDGAQPNDDSHDPQISGAGRHVIFESRA
ncbi:MAG: LamG-like jellyroll fold domain-containing protein, partial [Chloroflexota bacterium]